MLFQNTTVKVTIAYRFCYTTSPQAAKVICSAKISSPGANGDPAPAANQADFCPTDPAVVCVTGDKIFRFFRVIDAQFKPLPLNLKMELQVYTAHCWLADEQVGTNDPFYQSCVTACIWRSTFTWHYCCFQFASRVVGRTLLLFASIRWNAKC